MHATDGAANTMTNPTDREEGALSELGDKERRFVEDQRRIEARTACCGDYWSEYAFICAGCPMLAVNRHLRTQDKDALLAQAAEVLRSIPSFDESTNPSLVSWWRVRVKPLLDKLGERE